MEINIKDYLSDEEIKDICKGEIRNHVRATFKEDDLVRIISNSAYYKAYGIVDDLLPQGYEETVVKKVEEIIDDIKSYTVFREKTYYSEASIAQQTLEKTIADMSSTIEQKVKEVVEKSLGEENYESFMEKVIDGMWNNNKITFNFSRG
jgi:ribosomal protein S3AE